MKQTPQEMIRALIGHGLSENEIARRCKVSQSTISRVLRGLVDPQYSTVLRLQNLFSVYNPEHVEASV